MTAKVHVVVISCKLALATTLAALPAFADSQPAVGTAGSAIAIQGSYLPTDELISQKAVQRMKPRRAPVQRKTAADETGSAAWLFDYIGRLIDKEPEAAKRVRVPAKTNSTMRASKAARDRKISIGHVRRTTIFIGGN